MNRAEYERRFQEEILHNMEIFLGLTPRELVNSYDLTTDNDPNMKVEIDILSAVFPQVFGEGLNLVTFAVSEQGKKLDKKEFHRNVLGIMPPERITRLDMIDNPVISDRVRRLMLQGNFPIIQVAAGRIAGTDRPFYGMQAIAGYSPLTALSVYQNRVRQSDFMQI